MPVLTHPDEWAGAVKGGLTRKVGPLPVWGWGIIGGVGVFLFLRMRSGSSGGLANPVTMPGGGDYAGGGGYDSVGANPSSPSGGSTIGPSTGNQDGSSGGVVLPTFHASNPGFIHPTRTTFASDLDQLLYESGMPGVSLQQLQLGKSMSTLRQYQVIGLLNGQNIDVSSGSNTKAGVNPDLFENGIAYLQQVKATGAYRSDVKFLSTPEEVDRTIAAGQQAIQTKAYA